MIYMIDYMIVTIAERRPGWLSPDAVGLAGRQKSLTRSSPEGNALRTLQLATDRARASGVGQVDRCPVTPVDCASLLRGGSIGLK